MPIIRAANEARFLFEAGDDARDELARGAALTPDAVGDLLDAVENSDKLADSVFGDDPAAGRDRL